MKPSSPSAKPITLVVVSGDAGASRSLAVSGGLDVQTVLLPDPLVAVTLGSYKVDPCPRVFVLDNKGVIRHTNEGSNNAPQTTPAVVITSQALAALRDVVTKPSADKAVAGKARP